MMEDTRAREARLERWIRTYGTAILRACFVCLSDAKEAEDAMQETFLKAWRCMDHFAGRNGASEKTWLMHIAINVCRDMQRTRWFRHVDMRKALDDLPQGVTGAAPEDRTLLLDIMQLPDRYKQPILLYYYQDMTLEETAEALGISKSTVHNRLRKAECLLRLTLTDETRESDRKGGDCYVQ